MGFGQVHINWIQVFDESKARFDNLINLSLKWEYIIYQNPKIFCNAGKTNTCIIDKCPPDNDCWLNWGRCYDKYIGFGLI